jgi:hypothetical protein
MDVRDQLEKEPQHKHSRLHNQVDKTLYCEAFTAVSTEEVVARRAWATTENRSVAQRDTALRLQYVDLWRHMAPRIVWRQPRDEHGTRYPLKMTILRARLMKLKAMQFGLLASDIEGYELECHNDGRGGGGGGQHPPLSDDLSTLKQMRGDFRAGDVGRAAKKAQGRGIAPTHLACVQESLKRQNISTPSHDEQLLASGERQEDFRTFLVRVCQPEMNAAGVEAKDLDKPIVLTARSISKVVWGLSRGRAVGINGASVTHLKLLFPTHLHKRSEARRTLADLTAEIASSIVSGDMPVRVRQQQARALLIALYKNDATATRICQCIDTGVPIAEADIADLSLRPICVPAADICVFFKTLMVKLSGVCKRAFRRFQHAVFSRAAAAKSVIGTRLMREKFPQLVGLLCDIRSAYNEVSRLACIKALIRVRGLEQLVKAAWAVLSFPTELLMRTLSGFTVIENGAGVRQGDPISTAVFCAGLQQMLEFADHWLRTNGPDGTPESPDQSWAELGRLVSAFADDMQVWAVEQAIQALLETSTWVRDFKAILNLTLHGVKTTLVPGVDTPLDEALWQVQWQRGDYKQHTTKHIPADSPLQCQGFAIQNVEVGPPAYVVAGFTHRVDKAIGHMDRLMALFRAGGSNDRMMMYLILVSCVLPRLDYNISLSEDAPLKEQCERFDAKMDGCMLEVLDAPPFEPDTPEYEFMMAIIHLPVRHGGMGLVPRASLCESGVPQIGQSLLAIPALPDSRVSNDDAGETIGEGLAPSLNEHIGNMSQPANRWRHFGTVSAWGRFLAEKWRQLKQKYGQDGVAGDPLVDGWESMGASIEAGTKYPRYTSALAKPIRKQAAEALRSRAQQIASDDANKHSPLGHMAAAFLRLPHTKSISWFLQLATLGDVEAISADSLTRAALLPSGNQFRQMCADRNGWPCAAAVQLRMNLGDDDIRLIKPTAEFKCIISRQVFNDAMAKNLLDWYDTWDLYGHNARAKIYSMPERNQRHHSITYEIATALKLTGSVMDFECRRVHRRAGAGTEPIYKPDGVTILKATTLIRTEVDGKTFYDVGATDETVACLVETKGQSVSRPATGEGNDLMEAVDVKARAVVQSVRNEFKPDDLEIINQFMIVPAVVGFNGDLSKGLLAFIDNIAMLAAIRESQDEGSDPPATINRHGHSVRYLRYVELKRLFILRVQIAAGIAFAEGPESMALRTRGMVGGTLADHVTLSNPRGAFLTLRQFTSILQGARRQLDANVLRAQGPPPERSSTTARAAELMRLLYRERDEVRSRKKKADPTCGACNAVGHQRNHRCCPLHKNHHLWQAQERHRAGHGGGEADQQQQSDEVDQQQQADDSNSGPGNDADGGGAHQHDDDGGGSDGGSARSASAGGRSTGARGGCGGGDAHRRSGGDGSARSDGAGGRRSGARSDDGGAQQHGSGSGGAHLQRRSGSSGSGDTVQRPPRGRSTQQQQRRGSAVQQGDTADSTAVVPRRQPRRRRSLSSPLQQRASDGVLNSRSISVPADTVTDRETPSRSHTSNTLPVRT